jgi:hypothetical protein
MSLGLIPYQPLPFGLEENCTLPCSSWIQKIARTDRTSFQFTYGACGSTNNVLTNGDFTSGGTGWTVVGAWTYSFGWANSPLGGAGSIQQAISLTGFVELTFGLEVNAGSMLLSSNLGLIDFYTFGGSKSVVFDATGMTNINFFFGTAAGGRIQNVILRPIDGKGRAVVLNLDGSVASMITDQSWFTISDGFLTVAIKDWDSLNLPDGCYRIAIADPCQCSQFGFIGDDFDTPNQFVVSVGGSNNVDISGGEMKVLNNGVTAITVLRKNVLCVGTAYTITYTLTDMQAGDSFRFASGSANGILRTADGTYTETITVTATNDNLQDLRFVFGFAGGLHLVRLSGFTISAVTPVATYTSVPFQLTDKAGCSCTVLVEACGNGNQLNFGFDGTGFKPTIRLDGTLRGSGYPSTRSEYEYSTGKRVVPYARLRKARSLMFGAPEYVHDFMQTLIALDNVYLNGRLSHCEDDEYPTPSLDENVDYASVTMTFTDKTELTEKRPCAATKDIGCAGGGYGVTFSGTGGLPWGGGVSNKAESLNGLILTYNG